MSAWESFWRSVRRGRVTATLTCGCPDDGRPVYSCLKCDHTSCFTHWDDPHECPMSRAQTLAEEAADRIDRMAAELAAFRGQRHAAVDALREMSEGVRLALVDGGYFHSVDPVAGVRRMAGEYVSTVAELRAAKDRASDLAAEVAGLTLALDAARLRPSDTSDQDRRNCVDMSDRLAAVHREKDDLERQLAEREGHAAKPTVITGEGLSTWTPR